MVGVTVVMTTYNPIDGPRFGYAVQSITSLSLHLIAPELSLVLADDGSLDTQTLAPMARLVLPEWKRANAVTGPHNGIGASLNRAFSTFEGPWMYTTDDWVLTDDLDLTLPLWLLDEGYDLVRLGPLHPNLACSTRFEAGHGWWLDIDPWSNEFVFGTRPFLASSRLLSKIMPMLEGADSYAFEKWFCSVCRHAGISVAATTLHGPWETIGDDYPVGHLAVVPG